MRRKAEEFSHARRVKVADKKSAIELIARVLSVGSRVVASRKHSGFGYMKTPMRATCDHSGAAEWEIVGTLLFSADPHSISRRHNYYNWFRSAEHTSEFEKTSVIHQHFGLGCNNSQPC